MDPDPVDRQMMSFYCRRRLVELDHVKAYLRTYIEDVRTVRVGGNWDLRYCKEGKLVPRCQCHFAFASPCGGASRLMDVNR
jgi:hypothetical protein